MNGFLSDRRAVSTVEYAMIVVAVIGIIGAATLVLEGAFTDMFNSLGSRIQSAIS